MKQGRMEDGFVTRPGRVENRADKTQGAHRLFQGCSALITGASAGLGEEFARQLAPTASLLVLVARRKDRLEKLRDDLLSGQPDLAIHVLATDLNQPDEIERLQNNLEYAGVEIDLLINNAGLGDIGPFHNADLSRLQSILMVNVTALTLLTRAFLPGMIDRRRGTVLNVSSSAAYLPIAGFAVYAATKAYINSFSEGIRAELRGTGVTVTTLCPGPVETEFQQIARRPDVPARVGPRIAHVSAEQVVSDALCAAASDQPVVIPGLFMKIGMLLIRLLPMPIIRQVARGYQKAARK